MVFSLWSLVGEEEVQRGRGGEEGEGRKNEG